MNRKLIEDIDSIINKAYKPEEYPCIAAQQAEFAKDRPFDGLEILDSTPVFRNSILKYKALILGGATLTIGISNLVPYNKEILQFLKKHEIDIITPNDDDRAFDLVLDNAAVYRNFKSKSGYVELTRSGVDKYRALGKHVFLADSGQIKRIETCLGTGESYFRGLRHFGFSDFAGKRLLVFGTGKVGSGIIYYASKFGMKITAVTIPSSISHTIAAMISQIIDLNDTNKIIDAVGKAEFIVTATGVKSALEALVPERFLQNSHAVLANIGVEDEYGGKIPPERVLNKKFPVNFALEEPTRTRFIEATLALHNYGGVVIAHNMQTGEIVIPQPEIEQKYLKIISSTGLITEEINFLTKEFSK